MAEEEANMLARQLANAKAEADAKRVQEIATAARLKAEDSRPHGGAAEDPAGGKG